MKNEKQYRLVTESGMILTEYSRMMKPENRKEQLSRSFKIMKKVFTPDGEFLGMAVTIKTTENGVEITAPGDFPGMIEKNTIYIG